MDPTLPKKSPAAEAAQRAAQRHEAMRKEHEQKRAAAEHKREDVTQAKSQKLTAAKKETRSGRIDNPYYKPYGTGVVSPPGNKSPQSWDYRATTEAVVRKYKKPNLSDKQIMGLNATFSAKADDTKDAGMAQNPYESTRYVIPAEREPMDRADGVEVGYDKSVEPADKNMQLKRRKALKLAQMYRIDEDGGLGGDSGLGAGVSPMPGSFGGSSGATATRITDNPDGTRNYMLRGKTNKMKTLKTFKNEMGTPNKPFYNFGEEVEQVDEGGMPSSVIKHKQNTEKKTPEQLHADIKQLQTRGGMNAGKSVEDIARQMARSHGHGNMSPHYWNRIKHLEPKNEEVEYADESVGYKGSAHTTLAQNKAHGTDRNPIVVKNSKGAEIGTVHYSPIGNKAHGMKGSHYVATHIHTYLLNRGPYAKFAGNTSKQHYESPEGPREKVRDMAIRKIKHSHETLSSTKEEVEQVDEISTKLANKYFSKASKQSQKPDAKNRDAGMGMAYAKVQGRHANVPTTEAHDWTDDYKIGDHKALTHYANTKGGIDKDDMLKAAYHIKTGNLPALDKHLRKMDTAPRDKVIDYIHPKHYDALGFEALRKSNHKESTDVSEASKRDVAVRKFMSHDPEAGERILAMGKKEKETEKAFKSGKAEINRLKKLGEEDTKPKAPKEAVPFEGGHSKPKVHKDKFGNVIKPENMARHLARAAIPEEFELSETVDPVEARAFLDKHGLHNDLHPNSMSTDQVHGLLDHMKKHGYKVNPNPPGYPALTKGQAITQYHSHLKNLAIKEEVELSERVDPVEARNFLDTHGMRNKNFHSLSSDHVNRLLTHMKKHGYRAAPNSPGSPARMYHSHLERLANGISKHEKMRSNSAFTGYKEEVMSEGELDGGSMSGKANDTLEVGSVDSAKTMLTGKAQKVKEMAVRDAAGKKHTIKNVEIRMADGTLKSLPPGKSGSSGGGGK